MARKKKKLSRKEQARQRRAAVEQVRQERGWQSPSPAQVQAGAGEGELAEDILPLFPLLQEGPPTPDMMNDLMMILLDTADLAEEPEFEELLVNPLLAAETLAEAGQELGLTPAMLMQLPEEEQVDRQMDIIELTTRRLLTDELRRDVVEALERLRLRLKQSGDKQQLARVAALQSFLGQSKEDALWSMIGLVQAIVRRSVAAGFELMEASMEAAEESEVDTGDTATTVRQKLAQSGAAQKAEAVLKKIPGLTGFLEKQVDQTWEEGMDALFSGDLYLELFAPEEIEGGVKIFRETIDATNTGEPAPESRLFSEEKVSEFVSRLAKYLTGLMTPERLAQVRTRVGAALKDRDYARWRGFLFLLDDDLAREEMLESNIDLLVRVFIGELRAASLEPAGDAEATQEP